LTISISKDMSRALIQVARGIEPKYLQPPLGKIGKMLRLNIFNFMSSQMKRSESLCA